MKTYKDLKVEFIMWAILYTIGFSVLIPLFFKLHDNEVRWGTFSWDLEHVLTMAFWVWCFFSCTHLLIGVFLKMRKAKIRESEGRFLTKKEMKIDWWTATWDGQEIEFVEITKGYGRAEFELCAIWKRGKLVKVFLYPLNQPHAKHFYEIIPDNNRHWTGISYGHFSDDSKIGLKDPNIWDSGWCREHGCHRIRFYPPHGATKLLVATGLEKFNMDWK